MSEVRLIIPKSTHHPTNKKPHECGDWQLCYAVNQPSSTNALQKSEGSPAPKLSASSSH